MKTEFSKAIIICWWFCCSQLENFNRSHWLFAFTKKWDNIFLNSCDVYCQRLKKLHVKEMIYPFIIDESIYESCVVKTLSQQRTSKSPSCCSSMSRETLRPWKSYFWIAAAATQFYLGGKWPQSHFPLQHFPGQAAPPPPPRHPPAPPYQLHSCLSAWRGTGCCHGSLEARLALWRLLAGEACLSCTWEAWWGAWEVAEARRGERRAPPWTAWCTAAGWSPPRPGGDTTSRWLGMGKILTRRTIMQPAITPSITWVLKNYQPEILFWQAGGAKLQETQVKVETNIKVLQEDGTNTMTWVFCHRG